MNRALIKPFVISFLVINVLVSVSRIWFFDTCHATELRYKRGLINTGYTQKQLDMGFDTFYKDACSVLGEGSTTHFGFPVFYSLYSGWASGPKTILLWPLLMNILWTGAASFCIAFFWTNRRQNGLPKVDPPASTPPPIV